MPRRRGSRKHEVVAGKANRAGAVAHVNVEIDLLFQRLFHGGWQAGAKGDLVSLPVRQTFDADFATFGFERLRSSAVQRHEGRVVGILHQRFGKLDAGTRCHAVGIDRIVDDAEALTGAKVVIGRPRLGKHPKGQGWPCRRSAPRDNSGPSRRLEPTGSAQPGGRPVSG